MSSLLTEEDLVRMQRVQAQTKELRERAVETNAADLAEAIHVLAGAIIKLANAIEKRED